MAKRNYRIKNIYFEKINDKGFIIYYIALSVFSIILIYWWWATFVAGR